MKTALKLSLIASIIFICSSFTTEKSNGLDLTFGVSESDPSQIELNLDNDFTFSYQDLSATSQKIIVKGRYVVKNNKIHLIAEDDQIQFHDTWKISDDQSVARSRKGISFYTLRRK